MEEDILKSSSLAFDAPKEQSSYIKVIGVGGGGSNAVNHMYKHGITGVDFVVCNTDRLSLDTSPVPNKIQLGNSGLGAGNKPEVAQAAAQEKKDEIKKIISNNTKMLFITAGMGGGTGTGAAPVVAEIAKSITLDDDVDKILVVAIVTLPFSFEGPRRKKQAEEGIQELRKHVDSILIINNDKLRDYGDLTMSNAFGMADDILLIAAKGIAEIITVRANVAIDFRDVNTVMQNSGTALMGAGIAEGENRAKEAIDMAATSVLLNDNDISGAKNILLYFAYSKDHEITMDEMGYVTTYIEDLTGGEADLIWGAGFDDSLGEKLSITLGATGFEGKKNFEKPSVVKAPIPLEPENKDERVEQSKSVADDGIRLKATEKDLQPTASVFPGSIADNEGPSVGGKRIHVLNDVDNSPKPSYSAQTSRYDDGIQLKQKDEEPKDYVREFKVSPNTIEFPTLRSVEEEEALRKADRIRKISEMLRTSEGLSMLEDRPAFELLGMDLSYTKSAGLSDASGTVITGSGDLIDKNNYIHKDVD